MKVVCSVSLFLLLSAGALAAQQTKMDEGTNEGCLIRMPPHATPQQQLEAEARKVCPMQVRPPHCPIAMRAQHMPDGEIVTTKTAKPRGIGQWLHLTLTSRDSRRITKATFTVRGSSPKSRVMQTLGNGNDPSEVSATLAAEFTAGPDGHDLADLWVPGMTAVQSVEVSSLTYADGSTWNDTENTLCRVAPDGFMPVSGR